MCVELYPVYKIKVDTTAKHKLLHFFGWSLWISNVLDWMRPVVATLHKAHKMQQRQVAKGN